MITDISEKQLKQLLNTETYNIDINQKQTCKSIYINTMTLFKKYELLKEGPLRDYLEKGLATGIAEDKHQKSRILGNMMNVNIPLKIEGNSVVVAKERGGKEQYIRSSEHLYQALRFESNENNYQMDVLGQASSMTAKKKAKRIICRPFHKSCFQHFDPKKPQADKKAALEIIRIMYQVLRIKLAYKQKLSTDLIAENFGKALLQTGDKQIIEIAPKQSGSVDTFWGARILSNGTLVGSNVMGKLLMLLRANYQEDVQSQGSLTRSIEIPEDLELSLLDKPIKRISNLG